MPTISAWQAYRPEGMRCCRIVSLVVLLLAIPLVANAQLSTGTIAGRVTDESGAVVADAGVVVTNVATGVSRSGVTDAQGVYSFPSLPPGNYRVEVDKPGFSRVTVEDAVLDVNHELERDVLLRVGNVSKTVTVQASAVAVETTTPVLSQVITQEQVVQLPLNGRDFLQLATLAPGVTTPGEGGGIQGGSTGTAFAKRPLTLSTISIAGQREFTTDTRIDGIPTKDMVYGPIAINLSPDAIAEFSVQRGYSPPDQGIAGRIDMVTKSGTNNLHGSVWEFLRNDVLDANDYFTNSNPNPADRGRLPYRQNQFGGALGGPILRNKLFFFVDYEGLRTSQSTTTFANVPTPQELSGNFTAPGEPIIIDPTTGTPFPGNIIPANRISHFANLFNPLMPVANCLNPGICTRGNDVTSEANLRDDNQGTARIDYTLSPADSLFGRLTWGNSNVLQTGLESFAGIESPLLDRNAVVGWTHIFNQNVLNSFRIGLDRVIADPYLPQGAATNPTPGSFGLQNLTTVPQCNAPPTVNIGALASVGPGFLCLFGTTNNIEVSDNLSWIRGRHHLQFGFDYTHVFLRQVGDVFPTGFFLFEGFYTKDATADYLLGDAFGALGEGASAVPDSTGSWPALSIGDEIRATSKLTVNLGLRWEYFQPLVSKTHNLVSFNPFTPGGGWLYEPGSGLGGVGAIGPPGLQYPNYKDFSPRIGLAYALTPNTSLRASYGIFYQTPAGNQYANSGPPFDVSYSVFGTPATPLNLDSGGFFSLPSPPYSGPGVSGFGYDPHVPTPYLQNWTASIQHMLPGSILLETAYTGSKGTHLDKRDDINRASMPGGPRPFPNFSSMLWISDTANSWYHALDVSATKRMGHGLMFLASYTYSKSEDEYSFDDLTCRCYVYGASDKALSEFDQRHRFSLSWIYDMPAPRFDHSFASAVLGGWELTGITTIGSGYPFFVSTSTDYSNRPSAYGENLPDQLCNGNLPNGQRTVARWFNTACFVAPAMNTLGNGEFNNLTGPGMINQDVGLLKNFGIPKVERMKLQFRSEFFNVFNRANFGRPVSTLESPTFGEILTVLPGREVQFSLKLAW